MSEAEARSALIVGGGISGLATAWFLYRRGFEVRVLESASRVGGVIDTHRRDGYSVELGPNTTLQKPGRAEDALGRMLDETGLSARALEAAPAGQKRFILRNGKVLALPASPPAFLTTPAFSPWAKLRLLREPFIKPAVGEESIAQFVTRRLGREFLDYAIDPFISGVYAGDTRQLSVQAAVPRIYELEQQHGSLIRGAMALGKVSKATGQPKGRQISFAEGMAALPAGIAGKLPAGSLRTQAKVRRLEPLESGWRVQVESSDGGPAEETAGTLVLALPAREAAELIRPQLPEASGDLDEIPYVSIVTTGLGYRRDQITHPLDGFGFLVPRVEGVRTLGALFSSSLFDGRAPEDHVLLTAFVGGAHDPEAAGLPDENIAVSLQTDLAAPLGIRGEPAFRRITKWERAIPQYTLEHLDRIANLDRHLASRPGLFLTGSWRGGISVADCIRSAETLAQGIAESFRD